MLEGKTHALRSTFRAIRSPSSAPRPNDDPRAAKDSNWNALAATKAQLECCDRPKFLQGAAILGTDYFELLSLGNFITARPESNVFAGTKYNYLGTANRIKGLVSTIPADLVRPSDGATPLDNLVARNLPTEGTTTEGVVALNTGEVVTVATDLAIKGRGIDFVLTRYYSSAIAHIGRSDAISPPHCLRASGHCRMATSSSTMA